MERIRNLFQEALFFAEALFRPVWRSLRENAGLAVLSVVLAFALWVFVTDSDDTTRSGVLPFDLPVEPVNVPNDVALASPPPAVRVRVDVDSDVWGSLDAADFEATVDLSGLGTGTYQLPVRIRALTARGGLRVIGAVPREIEVRLEPLFSKSVPVTVEMEGTVPSGYRVGTVDLKVETVLVTGPRERVTLVSRAEAPLDLTGRTETVTQSVRLEPRDERGFLVEGVTLEPGVVKVVIPIEQVEYSRVLVVSPTVQGSPAEGYNVTDVQVTPSTVTVFGPQEFVQQATSIRTAPVDIEGAAEDVIRTVALELPAGTSVSGAVNVTVTVRIEPAQGEMALTVALEATALPAGLQLVGALPTVGLILAGDLPVLNALGPEDVRAWVSLSSLGPGTQRVPVEVAAPEGVQVVSVSPREVEITLEKR